MGHTLIAVLSAEDEARLAGMLTRCGIRDVNKIPYGRGCDRSKADAVLTLPVTGGRGWGRLLRSVEKQMGTPCKTSPYITLAISKTKHAFIRLTVTGARLYHIWEPVTLTSAFH